MRTLYTYLSILILMGSCQNFDKKIQESAIQGLEKQTFLIDLYKYEKLDTLILNNQPIVLVSFSRGTNPSLNNYCYAMYQLNGDLQIKSELKVEGDRYSFGKISIADWSQDGEEEIIHDLEHPLSPFPGNSINLTQSIYKKDSYSKYRLILSEIIEERICLEEENFGKNRKIEFLSFKKNKITGRELIYKLSCENFNQENNDLMDKKLLDTRNLIYLWNQKSQRYELDNQ